MANNALIWDEMHDFCDNLQFFGGNAVICIKKTKNHVKYYV